MNQLTVETGSANYPIYFEECFENLLNALSSAGLSNRKVCIVTERNVDAFYGQELFTLLQTQYKEVFKFAFTPGEQNKNLKTIEEMYHFFIEHHLDRNSVIVALGGGVTGDMAGFAAATYMRGIPFVQVPTSLLAQVDSSVGGKVGVDFDKHKNMVGAFYQPRFVYINVNTLKTLPTNQLSAGMGEVIKHGMILDEQYYHMIRENRERIFQMDVETLKKIIRRSCELKTQIVSEDEKESGLREILNFGHTIGHAVERLYNFELLHGECIAVGMVAAAYISYQRGLLTKQQLNELEELLEQYQLPTRIQSLKDDQIYHQLFLDKKVKNNQLSFVLLSKIGEVFRTNTVEKEEIFSAISYIIKRA